MSNELKTNYGKTLLERLEKSAATAPATSASSQPVPFIYGTKSELKQPNELLPQQTIDRFLRDHQEHMNQMLEKELQAYKAAMSIQFQKEEEGPYIRALKTRAEMERLRNENRELKAELKKAGEELNCLQADLDEAANGDYLLLKKERDQLRTDYLTADSARRILRARVAEESERADRAEHMAQKIDDYGTVLSLCRHRFGAQAMDEIEKEVFGLK